MENKKLSSLEYKEMMAQKERAANSDLSQAVFGKLPPQNIEIEDIVLGVCMIDNEAYPKIASILQPIHFYKEVNQVIYKAFVNLYNTQSPIDRLTVFEQMQRDNTLDKIGGNPYYLVQLSEGIASSAHIESHARLISQKYLLRETIQVSTGAITQAYAGTTDALNLLDTVQQKFFELSQFSVKKQVVNASVLGANLRERLQRLRSATSELSGISTGMPALDKLLKGWQDGNLIVIGARPSMGKSAFVNSLVINAAKKGVPTCLFSLEMAQTEITSRMVANFGNFELDALGTDVKASTDAEFEALLDTTIAFEQLPIYVDDSSELTVLEIAAKIREHVQRKGVKMAFVDYLGLITGHEKSAMREREVSEITRILKVLAKDLGIPIVLLTQLNRELEKRPNKRPQMSDIRESGAVEQNADIVGFIHRPEYYGITEYEDGSSTKGLAEIIIAKHRNGAIGDVRLRFDGRYQRFWDEASEAQKDFEDALQVPKITPQDNLISTERIIFDSDYSPF